MEQKRISIILPVYNVADYLGKCLDSVLAQAYQNLDIIVVDDGSTDETPAICDAYAEKDERIRVVHKENEGVSVARNTGISLAEGEYIFFFDGDDFVEADAVETVYEAAVREGADTVIYGYYRFENRGVKEVCFPKFPKDTYRGDEIVKEVMPAFIGLSSENVNDFIAGKEGALYVENPALWRVMVSTQVIRENRLEFRPGLKVGEDTVFISDYLSVAKHCYVLQKCFYYLVTRESSTIYQYEKNSEAKLEGKRDLLTARKELTKRIYERSGEDVEDTWRGTVIMSVMELAFLFAGKSKTNSFGRRYRLWKSYVKEETVKEAVKAFPLRLHVGIRLIPFLLLKLRCFGLLFLAVTCLKKTGYTFQRS